MHLLYDNLHPILSFNPLTNLGGFYCCYHHFMGEKIEALELNNLPKIIEPVCDRARI